MTALATADSTANACLPFSFESHQVRIAVNSDGNPWFVAKDVCAALDISWTSRTLDPIPSEWKRLIKISNPGLWGDETHHPKKKGGLRGALTFISEPAVYKLAFRSNKPEADRFTNKVASEVIPALRRQGKYEICPTTGTLTSSQQQELKELVQAKASAYPDAAKPKVFSQIWTRLQRKFKIPRYSELPVSQFGEARDYIIAMQIRNVDAPALPASDKLTTIRDYAWFYPALPDNSQVWRQLSFKAADAFERFGKEIDAIKAEAFRPFKENRRSGVATFLDDAMGPHYALFRIADEQMRTAYRCIYEAMDGLVATFSMLRKG